MFKSRTLLILGAGASHDVGMPLGMNLISEIGKRLNFRSNDFGRLEGGSQSIADALKLHARRTGDSFQMYIDAALAIRDMAPMAKSIDDIIDRRNDARISLCGKLAIAECILDAERSSALFIPPPHEQRYQGLDHEKLKSTWLYSFIHLLIEGVAREQLYDMFGNISVISFNYDRCFRYFLLHALQLQYGLESVQAQAVIRNLKVIYPYGTISPLEFEDNGLKFGGNVNGELLLDVSNQIKTFTEQADENEVMPSIKREVNLARQIVFLGLAFYQQNLRLLLVDQLSKKRIIGTAYGISEPNRGAIKEELKQTFEIKSTPPLEHGINLQELSCRDLIDNYSRILVS